MDIKNSKEIILEFVERYNFSNVFTDKSLPLGNRQASLFFNNNDAVSYLLSSSLTGNKSIGFFGKLPAISITHSLRGECIFISSDLPDRIDIPTIFCRKVDELSDTLVLAIKVASESKLPISVIISNDAANNYTESEKMTCDLVRTSPYLHKNTYKTLLTNEDIDNCISVAEGIIKSSLGENVIDGDFISFDDNKFPFFKYLMPFKAPEIITDGSLKTLYSYPLESKKIEKILTNSFGISLPISPKNEDIKAPEIEEFLCPGCPIVNVVTRIKEKEFIIFTDINCKGILSAYDINIATLDEYLGIISENLNINTVFIGSASSYRPFYDSMLANGKVIFLNDCSLPNIKLCTTIKHPKKANFTKNTLFPYSCGNIKKYFKARINSKKCKCIENNQSPICIEQLKCPALYIKNNTVIVDNATCTGCLACKAVCTFGAVK